MLEGKYDSNGNRESPKRYWENDLEGWTMASVWRVGRIAEFIEM